MSDLCIVVICNNDKNIPWVSDAVSFLSFAFNQAGVCSEFIPDLKHNTPDVHPSWYKLMVHRHLEWKYNYCLCWDLDLLPTNKHSVSDIISEIKQDKFYACRDTGIVVGGSDSYFTEIPNIVSNFRWNCGLFGIPRSQSEQMENIYHKHNMSQKPSYEQYHIADYLFNNKHMVVDGNPMNNILVQAVATSKSNHILHFASSNCLHYSISDPQIRSSMIVEHCSWKERIFRESI